MSSNSTTRGAPPVRLSKLSLVILYVRDPIASLAFYRDLLGMTVQEESPQWVQLDAGGASIALHPHSKIPEKRDAASPWVVFEVDDVRATHAALVARGARFLTEPARVCGDATYDGLSADLEDPDGNRISLFGKVPVGA